MSVSHKEWRPVSLVVHKQCFRVLLRSCVYIGAHPAFGNQGRLMQDWNGYSSISYAIGKACDNPPRFVAAGSDSIRILSESPPLHTAGGGY